MLTVLGSGKPLTYEWDVANQEATAIAEQKFNELAASGAALIETKDGETVGNIRSFKPTAEEILAVNQIEGG